MQKEIDNKVNSNVVNHFVAPIQKVSIESSLNKNYKSRKFLLVINNPEEHGLTEEIIKDIIASLNPDYACYSYEIGEQGTLHIHIFVYRKSTIRFSTLKKKFPTAHIESAQGSCAENKDYVSKSGKWENSKKAETSIEGSFTEFGVLPPIELESLTKSEMLLNCVKADDSIMEILEKLPNFSLNTKAIENLIQNIKLDEYSNKVRDINVEYIYDSDESYDRGLLYKGNNSICRIVNYGNGKGISFDSYKNQDVMLFDNFIEQLSINELINYIDGYPLMLPVRFCDKVACYSKVIIISTISLENIYANVSSRIKQKFINNIDVYTVCENGVLESVEL